jgi:hypothetical protein
LNTIFERTKDHLVAFVEIAFISILSRRLNRLVAHERRAWHLQTTSDKQNPYNRYRRLNPIFERSKAHLMRSLRSP